MGYTIAQKIIKSHLVSGEMKVGSEIGLRIDQTLTQDATGTMAYIQLEATESKPSFPSHILTIIPCRQALKTPMTTDIFRL